MANRHCTFRVTYWGVTGSLSRPLQPAEVCQKLVRAVGDLLRQGALTDGDRLAHDEELLRQRIEQHLPFYLRSTYGGNTTCIEIETADALLIVDAGSGIRELGIELSRRWNSPDYRGPREAHVLLTHSHMDHTYGTPFFDPYYDARNHFTIWGSHSAIESLNAVLKPTATLSGVFFPPTFVNMAGIREMKVLSDSCVHQVGKTRISTHALTHPGGCTGYRFDRGGCAIVIATDHEQGAAPDRALADFSRGADLLYADAQYTQDEYEGRQGIPGEPPYSRRGWGHSSLEDCVTTAVAANVRRLHLGHREPKRNDEDCFRFERQAKQLMKDLLRSENRDPEQCSVEVCYEGLTIDI